jgi:hypothetical protein
VPARQGLVLRAIALRLAPPRSRLFRELARCGVCGRQSPRRLLLPNLLRSGEGASE